MGETGENVAEKLGVSREDQDAFTLASQRNAAAAVAEGRYRDQLVAIPVPQRKGDPIVVDADEHPDRTPRRRRWRGSSRRSARAAP